MMGGRVIVIRHHGIVEVQTQCEKDGQLFIMTCPIEDPIPLAMALAPSITLDAGEALALKESVKWNLASGMLSLDSAEWLNTVIDRMTSR